MTHPILALQASLVAALRTIYGLVVADAPAAGMTPPYVVIARHDLLPRDGDGMPGSEHRLVLHCWAEGASRKAAITLAETVLGTITAATLNSATLAVTLRRLDRIDTAIDGETGKARAALALTFFTEPA